MRRRHALDSLAPGRLTGLGGLMAVRFLGMAGPEDLRRRGTPDLPKEPHLLVPSVK
jgi:hypothetical protein